MPLWEAEAEDMGSSVRSGGGRADDAKCTDTLVGMPWG